jgi:4-hydroxybenzoate polyprenyltransferase
VTSRFQIVGLAKATHFVPTVLVVSISFILSLTQVDFFKSVMIALAILAGQCTVGWTNELVDQNRDTAAGRLKKPLVAGTVTATQLKFGVAVALLLAVLLSYLGPLGVKGGSIHMLGLLSAAIYNFGAKGTWLSPVPYAISFGAMPWALYESVGKHPPLWLYIDFALVSIAYHFVNVIKDLEWDRAHLVLGLPQRIGKTGSAVMAGVCVLASLILLLAR